MPFNGFVGLLTPFAPAMRAALKLFGFFLIGAAVKWIGFFNVLIDLSLFVLLNNQL